MTCSHTNQKFDTASKQWLCKSCEEPIAATSKWKPEDGVPMMSMPHDVTRIDEKNLQSSQHMASVGLTKGAQQERAYSEMVNDARSNYKPVEGVKAHYKVPPEVFFARRKEDPHYWDNPKNVARHSDMKISD